MLQVPTPEQAKRIRTTFRELGFTMEELQSRLGVIDPPPPNPGSMERFRYAIRASEPFHLVVRLLLGGEEVAESACGALPSSFVDTLCSLGVLDRVEGRIVPRCLIVPHEGIWLASDRFPDLEAEERVEHVLSTGPVARYLSHFTVRRRFGRVLDLCGGSGIQGLIAADHCDEVWITDLNVRAVQFAEFNAALSGVENAICRAGSGFDPVAGQRFDLIVCNPPFVLAPARQLMAFDNQMDLDQFCQELIAEATRYLVPGGLFQMIFEWVELEGEPWQERLLRWFESVDADVWVLKANTQRPDNYASTRIKELGPVLGEAAGEFDEWMSNYERHRVRAIHGGLLVMRQAETRKWIQFDELSASPEGPVGTYVESTIRRLDRLAEFTDVGQFLEGRFELDPLVRLEQELGRSEANWSVQACQLRRAKGFPQVQPLDPSIARFLVGLDGKRPLRENIEELTRSVGAEPERVRGEAIAVVRRMVERGFVLPV